MNNIKSKGLLSSFSAIYVLQHRMLWVLLPWSVIPTRRFHALLIFFLIQVAAEYYYSALQSLEEGNFILLAYSRKVPISESEQEKEQNKVNQKT